MISERTENNEMYTNKYELLSQFHPCLNNADQTNTNISHNDATLTLKYYWGLGPSLTKEVLLKKASDNFKLALVSKDTEYLTFLEAYLKKEGYEIDLKRENVTLQDLETCINQKAKIKLQINMPLLRSIPIILPSIENKSEEKILSKTHSKIKTKQHEQALIIQKLQESKQEKKLNVNDPVFLNAIKQIGYKLPEDGSVVVASLRRAIIIYVSQKDLQMGLNFRLDDTLKYVLLGPSPASANLGDCSYFTLKGVLSKRLANLSETTGELLDKDVSALKTVTSEHLVDPGLGNTSRTVMNVKTVNRIPIKMTQKTII